jgi:hypothetical protein
MAADRRATISKTKKIHGLLSYFVDIFKNGKTRTAASKRVAPGKWAA